MARDISARKTEKPLFGIFCVESPSKRPGLVVAIQLDMPPEKVP